MTLPFVITYLERIKEFKNQGFCTNEEYDEYAKLALKIEQQFIKSRKKSETLKVINTMPCSN